MTSLIDTPIPPLGPQDAARLARWLVATVRPHVLIDAGDSASMLLSALARTCAEAGIQVRRMDSSGEGAEMGRRHLILLSSDRVGDGWQLMDWVTLLGEGGLLVLDGLPPRDCPVPTRPVGDGQHWVIVSSLQDAELRDTAAMALAAPPLSEVRSLEHAVAMLQQERTRLLQTQQVLGLEREKLKEASAALQKAERRLISLKRALETSGLSAQSTLHSLHLAQAQISELLHSRSWRVTAPLRFTHVSMARVMAILKRFTHLAIAAGRATRQHGAKEAARRTAGHLRNPSHLLRGLAGGSNWKLKPTYRLPPARGAVESLHLRVLLVAEMGIGQCLKYRVLQKQQMIQDLGFDCSIVNWTDSVSTRDLLNSHSVAIFYRVPGYPDQLETIELAKSLGVRTFWEVDDLIFDLDHYRNNSNLNDLSPALRKGVLEGVPLYRSAMLACGACIASTTALAKAMHDAGIENVWVVENALDIETLRAAEEIAAAPPRGDGLIRIVYGSGSKAHDSDFRVAARGILRVLQRRYDVRLTIIGHLNLPPEFKTLDAQIERLPPSDYPTYMKRLAKCQINIAPLEDTVFNDAKSNIKYLEAAILGIPTVCTPTVEYRQTVEHGVTGFLASTPEEWEEQLLALLASPTLRRDIGERARQHVEDDYTPQAIGKRRLAPLLTTLATHRASRPRVLGVNIFFEPRSFGGATIVAEQVARLINAAGKIEYGMFTTLPATDVHIYKIVRYQSSAGEVFAMGLPHEHDPALQFDNPYPVAAFTEVLRSWRPDVVHIHSIQGIGIRVAEACQQEGVPFVVTLHDAWWICARQFMVNDKGRYCYQRKIDLDVCATCVPQPALNPYRQHRLHEVLTGAALLISPSQFFTGIYADNGFDPNRIIVNKNGIAPPRMTPQRIPPSQRPLRFGFVGGEGPIKGSALIKKALTELPHRNYELHVVDNELNLGRRSIFESNWPIPGELKVVPAYTQETIDDFFEGIDVLLFPTQWKESFGLSVREALIRDVWVIATDAGGVIEDIVDGENGDIIPLEDDGERLKEAVRRLLDNPTRLDGYRNPHAGLVRLFQEQADELTAMLLDVADHQPVSWRPLVDRQ